MNKFIFALSLTLTTFNCHAGELVKDATIRTVGNTSVGGPDFYVRLTGGIGPCANDLIKFPESKKASEDSHQQAMSIALTALTTGKKVRMVNFDDDDCHGANFISISN